MALRCLANQVAATLAFPMHRSTTVRTSERCQVTVNNLSDIGCDQSNPCIAFQSVEGIRENKIIPLSIFSPSKDQLHDFFEVLPLMKNADLCIFTEEDLCQLACMADPFEAMDDLFNRCIRALVVLRSHSIVIALEGKVNELTAPTGIEPCRYYREYLKILHDAFETEPTIPVAVSSSAETAFNRWRLDSYKNDESRVPAPIGRKDRPIGQWLRWLISRLLRI
jgi:hypothetical protein